LEIIRRNTDYGLRALLVLAQRDGPASVAHLAQQTAVPAHFLHKVMRALAGAGVVSAQRGPGGGYSLALPPEQVSVAQVMQAVQGPLVMNRCLLGPDRCPQAGSCRLTATWQAVQEQVVRFLETLTLARLLAARHPGPPTTEEDG